MITKPKVRPVRTEFSSGPCPKHPGWTLNSLENALLGRSHRSKPAKARIKHAIDRTREILEVPEDYLIAVVPGSDTGAVEMAIWSLLGPKPVDVFAWESFGKDWVVDILEQLQIEAKGHIADFGILPNLGLARDDADIVFTWNGTTSGVCIPNMDWLNPNPDRIVICDATSACFAQELEWEKLDVITYSWQKVLGGEAAHGMLILSPNAVKRMESHTPSWPVPKLFRMSKNGKINKGLFEGATINTPSLLCIEDYLQALNWVEQLGGLSAMITKADANKAVLENWVSRTDWIEFLCKDTDLRSNTGVCMTISDPRITKLDTDAQRVFVRKITDLLEQEGVGMDFEGYRDAPPGFRVWCGGTLEASDIEVLTHWMDWAFAELIQYI